MKRHSFKLALLLGVLVALVSSGGGAALDRTTSDRPDERSCKMVHPIFATNVTGNDRQLDTNGKIAQSLKNIDAWLEPRSGLNMCVDISGGQPDISYMQVTKSSADIAANPYKSFGDELTAAGFTDQQKVYLVYYDGAQPQGCGFTSSPPNSSLRMAVIFTNLDTPKFCFAERFGTPTINTIDVLGLNFVARTQGLVSSCSRNTNKDGFVNDDPNDLLYRSGTSYGVFTNPATMTLDKDRNDYLNAGISGCPDLGAMAANGQYFVAATRTLTISKSGDGAGSVQAEPAGDCTGATCNFPLGTKVVLTASATVGNRLVGWTGCTPDAQRPIHCTVTVNDSVTVTAEFARLEVFTPNVSISISGRGRVEIRDSKGELFVCRKSCLRSVAGGRTFFLFIAARGSIVYSCAVPGSTGRCATMAIRGRKLAASVGKKQLKVRVVFAPKEKM